jgi:hypothetical protein
MARDPNLEEAKVTVRLDFEDSPAERLRVARTQNLSLNRGGRVQTAGDQR